MNTGAPTLYGVGLGPGDPDLLTRKAIKIIKKVPVVMVPFVGAESRAARIVRAVDPEATVVGYYAPMTRDPEERDRAYSKAAKTLAKLLERFHEVAVCNLGDPTLYATFWHIVERIPLEDFEIELVPGIPAGLLCAARIGRPLAMESDKVLICTREPPEDLESTDTVILYKPTRRGIERLLRKGFEVYACRDLGFKGERVERVSAAEFEPNYLCTIVALRP
ncbi:precorrin-2 C(20)-methyltransferase [Methanopyrus sp.]